MSQANLAALVNITRHSLERYENGALKLSPATVNKICDVLDLDSQKRAKRRLQAAAATIASEIERHRAS
jgi:DNA-binding XRE family transcriptional regulator